MKSHWALSLLLGILSIGVGTLGHAATPKNAGAPAEAGVKTSEQPQTEGETPENKPGLSYDKVVAKAKARADKPYSAPPTIPKFLSDLSYADLDTIRFKREQALWHGSDLPFEVMFYHPGSYYTHPVTVHLVNQHGASTFAFDKNRFSYDDKNLRERVPEDLGYAGFKLLHALACPCKQDEVLSFLGASYFRAIGTDQHYGLSARGLAIDTGSSKGEEFPSFTDFWLVKPDKGDVSMTIYAVLDSPSVAGAYRFVVTPGRVTKTAVDATLFTRKPIQKLGVAPLTSMFMWGENSLARLDDYRPEAHDSDGLLIAAASGEWLWRPLFNPQKLSMNQLSAGNVRGFGLMQRDRDFDHYQDLDYEYERRPNAWVTPHGDWGDGHLELVQIPSDSEVNDNIALFWIPAKPVTVDERLHFSYDIGWGKQSTSPDSLGQAVASRIGRAAVVPGQPRNTLRVVIDFVGGALGDIKNPEAVQPRVNAMRDATINDIEVVRNPHTGGWRLTFLVPTDALNSPLELRAFLAGADGGALTETWSYALSP